MREVRDREGEVWEAFAADAVVAHGRPGAVLAFRRVGSTDAELLQTSVTFNSKEAASSAISSMGEKELQRRLENARASAGL